jgi:23S rRNA (cytidine2498-2'-O)-methyltransferase
MPNASALDLGAAPGGWSKVLLDAGCRVTAVDPGALDVRLAHPRLSYICATAQRFFAAQPAGTTFDIIVNDMKMDMYDSVRIMLDAAHLLSPGGTAVMTLKLTKGQGLSKINKALDLLAKKYRVADARQLFHNRDEVTVLLLPVG